jgi:cobalt-zinc-cadmium efflux system membrane fusion protein
VPPTRTTARPVRAAAGAPGAGAPEALFEAEIAARKDYEAAQQPTTRPAATRTPAPTSWPSTAPAGADRAGLRPALAHRRHRDRHGRRPGRLLERYQRPVMTVADLSTVWLSASVAERTWRMWTWARGAHRATPGLASLRRQGRLRGRVLDPATRT